MDLDGPEPMCEDCRVVGPDGKPLGWDDGLPTEQTGPTQLERTEHVLRDAWQAFVRSPVAGDLYQWQAAALQRAGLLASAAAGTYRDAAVTGAARELRVLTTCHCEQAWTGRGLHAPDCLEEWRVDVETLVVAAGERDAIDSINTGRSDEAPDARIGGQ